MVCEYIPEVPSRLNKQSISIIKDTLPTLYFQLITQQEDQYLDFAQILFTDIHSKEKIPSRFDSTGYKEITIQPSDYSLQIHCLGAPDFVIDTIHIEAKHAYTFEIILGELAKYQSVILNNKH